MEPRSGNFYKRCCPQWCKGCRRCRVLGKKVILAGERHAVAQKPGLVIDRVPGNAALLLEHEIFKG